MKQIPPHRGGLLKSGVLKIMWVVGEGQTRINQEPRAWVAWQQPERSQGYPASSLVSVNEGLATLA